MIPIEIHIKDNNVSLYYESGCYASIEKGTIIASDKSNTLSLFYEYANLLVLVIRKKDLLDFYSSIGKNDNFILESNGFSDCISYKCYLNKDKFIRNFDSDDFKQILIDDKYFLFNDLIIINIGNSKSFTELSRNHRHYIDSIKVDNIMSSNQMYELFVNIGKSLIMPKLELTFNHKPIQRL